MSEKKKLSKFGKVWIIVCVAAVVVGLLVAAFGPIASAMREYHYHDHEDYCGNWTDGYTSDCPYYYGDAHSYAMYYRNGLSTCIVFAVGALIIANVVMLAIWLARKNSAEAAAMAEAHAPVSIPTGEGEQVVLERRYPAAFPVVLMVLGALSALLGIFLIDDEEVSIPLLVIGALFLVVGILLRRVLKIHLVVTTKRIYVQAPFASRANLPLNRISAVGTGLFHYLHITSAAGFAGQINLLFVPNYLEVYDTINALLNGVE